MKGKRYRVICNECEKTFEVIREEGFQIGDLLQAICREDGVSECLILLVLEERSIEIV